MDLSSLTGKKGASSAELKEAFKAQTTQELAQSSAQALFTKVSVLAGHPHRPRGSSPSAGSPYLTMTVSLPMCLSLRPRRSALPSACPRQARPSRPRSRLARSAASSATSRVSCSVRASKQNVKRPLASCAELLGAHCAPAAFNLVTHAYTRRVAAMREAGPDALA